MKRTILLLVLLAISTGAFCQWGSRAEFDREIWAKFKSSKLYVLLQGSEAYDNVIKSSIEKFWTFNKYEFVDANKYAQLNKSTDNFFLMPVKLTREKNYSAQEFIYLFLTHGRKNGKPEYNDPLADLQITGSEDILSGEFIIPITQLPVFVKYFQWYSKFVTAGKITDAGDLKKVIKQSSTKIKTKPLYVLDSDLNKKIKSEADIKKEYPGEVHVVTEAELAEIIEADTDAHLFFCVKNDAKAWDYVYNIKTGELLYYGWNLISGLWPAGIIPYHYKDWY